MVSIGKGLALVSQYLCTLRGGTQPILARASDGFLYVVKFANNLQGPNLLFNESAGNELYRACGLAVPQWKPLWVPESFLEQNRECWIQTPLGHIRPASGLCFGLRFLGGNSARLFEILPGFMVKRIRNRRDFWLAWLIDVCAEHADNRQAIFVEASDGRLDAHFIDHGHMFGGPNGESRRNFSASRYLDRRVYGNSPHEPPDDFDIALDALDVDKLMQQIEAIPPEWSSVSAFERFNRCVRRLKSRSLVHHIIETMVSDLEGRKESESGYIGSERKPPSSVLHFGLRDQRCGPSRAHNHHCA